MNKISTAAKKIKKEIKKEVDVPSLISYLEKLGYSTVFFNTESGDEILKAYGISLNNISICN